MFFEELSQIGSLLRQLYISGVVVPGLALLALLLGMGYCAFRAKPQSTLGIVLSGFFASFVSFVLLWCAYLLLTVALPHAKTVLAYLCVGLLLPVAYATYMIAQWFMDRWWHENTEN